MKIHLGSCFRNTITSKRLLGKHKRPKKKKITQMKYRKRESLTFSTSAEPAIPSADNYTAPPARIALRHRCQIFPRTLINLSQSSTRNPSTSSFSQTNPTKELLERLQGGSFQVAHFAPSPHRCLAEQATAVPGPRRDGFASGLANRETADRWRWSDAPRKKATHGGGTPDSSSPPRCVTKVSQSRRV